MAEPHPRAAASIPARSIPSPTAISTSSPAAPACVDQLVVGVARNTGKGPLFSLDERVELVRAEIEAIAERTGTVIEVQAFRRAADRVRPRGGRLHDRAGASRGLGFRL